jgi:hypothetical protein
LPLPSTTKTYSFGIGTPVEYLNTINILAWSALEQTEQNNAVRKLGCKCAELSKATGISAVFPGAFTTSRSLHRALFTMPFTVALFSGSLISK